jgi:hypothetical protein
MEPESRMNPEDDFADKLKAHMTRWAEAHDLAECVESYTGRTWVLAEVHRVRNLFLEEWWHHIHGFEHRWVRALNSSQCFAVNLFATLAKDPFSANRFLRSMLPERGITQADHVVVRFEHSPSGVPERLGERGQPTQMDVFFEVVREGRIRGAIGIEVKLSESKFGGCRGWNGIRKTRPINPNRERCLDARRVLESPEAQCYMAEEEGRRYWNEMSAVGGSFDLDRLAQQVHCPFRHGLYQMMRNRVALDVFQSITGAEWTEFVVCVHPANLAVARLPEPVAGESNVVAAFRNLIRPSSVLEWDASVVLEAIIAAEGGTEEWAGWMRTKYLLGKA